MKISDFSWFDKWRKSMKCTFQGQIIKKIKGTGLKKIRLVVSATESNIMSVCFNQNWTLNDDIWYWMTLKACLVQVHSWCLTQVGIQVDTVESRTFELAWPICYGLPEKSCIKFACYHYWAGKCSLDTVPPPPIFFSDLASPPTRPPFRNIHILGDLYQILRGEFLLQW